MFNSLAWGKIPCNKDFKCKHYERILQSAGYLYKTQHEYLSSPKVSLEVREILRFKALNSK
jgi:hypothetical protein